MTFSEEWEQRFRENTHISTWPWSDLVSYVHRYASPRNGYRKVLEIGCGVGANIPFFLALDVEYFAVEGSATAVGRVHQTFPNLVDSVVVGDFTKELPFDGPFDLIVDRSALISNSTESMKQGISLTASKLRQGGKYIAIDWFSTEHTDALRGTKVDQYTRTDMPADSHLADIGPVHFSDRSHILGLLEEAGLSLERLEHKLNAIVFPEEEEKRAWWNFVATKK